MRDQCIGRIPLGDRLSHCRCWLDLERPCCKCGADEGAHGATGDGSGSNDIQEDQTF